jgi:DNA-3-methyladenine glycosylase II
MDEHIIHQGIQALADLDPDVAGALGQLGPPPPRIRPAGFETFLSTIVSQQISTEAARAIMARVAALLPERSAAALLDVDDEALRGAGLSYRKVEYAKGLARAVTESRFDIEGLEAMADDNAIAAITALRGFGRWSAEIYLMFSLGRRDIFPADDLALQVALGRLKGLDGKPTPKQARELVAHWAPWRSVGSLFLWHYYRGAPN